MKAVFLKSPLYRVRQLTLSLKAAPLGKVELEFVKGLLNPQQAELYFALTLYEQRHALRVCRTLEEAGYGADRELLQAALLHDLGKRDQQNGRSVPLWGKVASVVLTKIGGRKLVSRLANPDVNSWRYVFWLQTNHERRGAAMAQTVGSSSRVVALIAGKDDPAVDILRWADDQN